MDENNKPEIIEENNESVNIEENNESVNAEENNESVNVEENNESINVEEHIEQTIVEDDNTAGKGAATTSLVLGIVSVVFWFFGWGVIVSIVCGIIGLVFSSKAKKSGFVGGIRTAGFICSLIGLIGGAIVFVACVACVGALGTAGLLAA